MWAGGGCSFGGGSYSTLHAGGEVEVETDSVGLNFSLHLRHVLSVVGVRRVLLQRVMSHH